MSSVSTPALAAQQQLGRFGRRLIGPDDSDYDEARSLFNAMFDEGFQVEMLRLVNERCGDDGRPDFVIYANRLFDPEREFEGKRGVAYGGPDLSARPPVAK